MCFFLVVNYIYRVLEGVSFLVLGFVVNFIKCFLVFVNEEVRFVVVVVGVGC